MLRGLAALAVVAVLAGPARADDLAKARAAVDASDYFGARGALDKALADGTASPDELADIYRMKGIVEAALGNDAAATTAFGKWLALDPKASLPDGTSPKITRPFGAAADQARAHHPIKVKTETTADPPSVTLVIVSDPFLMIAKARVFVRVDGGTEQELEATGTKRITIDLPRGKRLDLRVQGLDERGNRVVELGTADVPIVVIGGASAAAAPPAHVDRHAHAAPRAVNPRPVYLRWWLWTGAAVAVAGGASYVGLAARDETDRLTRLGADSVDHRFTEASALESDARRDAMIFNVGMGVAGALAIGAAVLYLTAPHAEAHVAAAPVHGGGAVVVGGSF